VFVEESSAYRVVDGQALEEGRKEGKKEATACSLLFSSSSQVRLHLDLRLSSFECASYSVLIKITPSRTLVNDAVADGNVGGWWEWRGSKCCHGAIAKYRSGAKVKTDRDCVRVETALPLQVVITGPEPLIVDVSAIRL
jgi:hypothetical protein